MTETEEPFDVEAGLTKLKRVDANRNRQDRSCNSVGHRGQRLLYNALRVDKGCDADR
jgi:hypothetical protein